MIKKAIVGILLTTSIFSLTPMTAKANVNMGDFKVTYYWPGEDNWGHQTATGVRSSNLYLLPLTLMLFLLGVRFLLMVRSI